jgi:phosphate starvation-inducible membrane PsiE
MSRPVYNYVHRIMHQFYVSFFIFIPHVVSYFFCLASSSSCAIQSYTDLHEVLAIYLGSLGYFLAQDPMLLNGCSSEKLMLNGESRVCSVLSLILYPKRVYFTSQTLIAEYWRSRRHMPLNKAITIT